MSNNSRSNYTDPNQVQAFPPPGVSQPVSNRHVPGSVAGYKKVGSGSTNYEDALAHTRKARIDDDDDGHPRSRGDRRPQQRRQRQPMPSSPPQDPTVDDRIRRLSNELSELRSQQDSRRRQQPAMPTAKMMQRRRQQQTTSKVPDRDEHGQLPPWNTERFDFRNVKNEDVRLPENNEAGRTGPDRPFVSVDGVTYTFRKASATNRDPSAAAQDMAMINMLAMMEMLKGGDPMRVYEAFRVRVNDVSEPSKTFFDYGDAESYRVSAGVDYDDVYAGIASTDTTGTPFVSEDGYDGFDEYAEDYDSVPGFSID